MTAGMGAKMAGVQEASSKALHLPVSYKGHPSLTIIIEPLGASPCLMHFDSDVTHTLHWPACFPCRDVSSPLFNSN